jgi:signal transduction histidine kinase
VTRATLVARWFAFVIALLLATPARAREQRVVGDEDGVRVGEALDLAYDARGELPFDAAGAAALAWTPSTKPSPSFGFREGAEWARLTLVPAHEGKHELVLVLEHPQIDFLDVRVARGGVWGELARSGDHVRRSDKPLLDRRPAIPVVVDGPTEVFLRVRTEGSHQLPLLLYARERYDAARVRDGLVQALYLGALVVIFVHSLLYGLLSRAPGSLAYCGLLASYVTYHVAFTGLLGVGVDAPIPWLADRVNELGTIGALYFAARFLEETLAGELASAPAALRALRWQHRLAVGALVCLVLPYGATIAPLMVVAGVAQITDFVVSVQALRGETRSARLTAAGLGAVIVAGFASVLRVFGLLPTNALTINLFYVATLAQFLLLSASLADRVTALQEAVIAQTRAAVDHLNEALAAREQAMFELERRRALQGELEATSRQLSQSQNMATLGMLMAGIAHDLRNPLNYVMAAAERLRELVPALHAQGGSVEVRQEAEEVVGWVEQGASAMDAISLAMRNQARGGAEVSFEPIVVAEVVREALVLCNARTKIYAFTVDACEDTIVADPVGLGQLVMNLASNAGDALAEYLPGVSGAEGRLHLVARVEGEAFVLEFHDSGPGIPDELRARILEPFFTTKPRGKGTGLGLAIVQRVVQTHGGTLEVGRSARLGGACFTVRWPREASAATP